MSTLPTLTDGDFSTRALVAPTKITRPFLNWPAKDTATKLFERIYEIDRASYTPFAALATLPNDGTDDPADAAAYLVNESEPALQSDGTQQVRCLFAHVPATKTLPGTIMLTKPGISGTFPQTLGSYHITKPDSTLIAFDIYYPQAVAADSGFSIAVTGGTYTLTFSGSTTGALAYNAAAATVQAALNGLASMAAYGSVTVAGTYSAGFTVTFSSYTTASADGTSLTGGTGAAALAIPPAAPGGDYGAVQYLNLERTGCDAATPSITPATGSATITQASNVFTLAITPAIDGSGIPASTTFTITLYGQTSAGILCTRSVDVNYLAEAAADLAAAIRIGIAPLTNLATRGYIGITCDVSNTQNIGGTNYVKSITVVVTVYAHITGGTYTLTYGANTTAALAYNASLATVQAAFTGLASVTAIGGATLAGSGYYVGPNGNYVIAWTVIFTVRPAITASAASLTPSPCAIALTTATYGAEQTFLATTANPTRIFTFTAPHNFTAGDYLYFNRTGTLFYGAAWSPLNANQISVSAGVSPFNNATLFTFVGKRTKAGYKPGATPVPCNMVTRYATSPLAPDLYQGDDSTLLQAIFSGNTAINYRVGDSTGYPTNPSPIYSLTTTQVSAANL
jgi:hypothetical protein